MQVRYRIEETREGFKVHSVEELNSGDQMLLKSFGSKSAMSVKRTCGRSRDSFHGPSVEQTMGSSVYLHVWAGKDKIVLTCVTHLCPTGSWRSGVKMWWGRKKQINNNQNHHLFGHFEFQVVWFLFSTACWHLVCFTSCTSSNVPPYVFF